jgi:catechol 2,3-dioxygenase-like lactoylglutathione lyase family enzyme
MRVRLDQIVVDCQEPAKLVRFWAGLLGGEPVDRAMGWSHVEPPGFARLAFQPVAEAKLVKNRLHLDIEVDSLEAAVARVQALGGRPAQERGTDFGWHFRIMADPEGNEFCLIEQAAGRDGVTLSPR